MTPEKHARWLNACGRKVRFHSQIDAARALSYLFSQRGDTLEAYKCRWCRYWHLGPPSAY